MRKSVAAFIIITFGLFAMTASRGEEAAAPNPAHPWEKDQALLKTVRDETGSGGIMSVQTHVKDMENALSGAKLTYVIDEPNGKVSYTLTDSAAEALVAMTMATMDNHNQKMAQAVAVQNPYPAIGLYLGSYYNEVGKPADALRVLDIGLSLSAISGLNLGDDRADLIAERGAALLGLQRWSDMLADYNDGLKIDDLDNLKKARMRRGRGLALIELGRLDEAEVAYKQSLEYEPNNALALHELNYIARVRAGAAPTPANVIPLQTGQGTPASPPH